LHLGLYTSDRRPGRAIAQDRSGSFTDEPDDDFRVLEDPDDNLLCAVQKDAGET
jgi:hypothetical protein